MLLQPVAPADEQVLKDLAETPPDGDDDDHGHGTFRINMFTMAPVRVPLFLLFSLCLSFVLVRRNTPVGKGLERAIFVLQPFAKFVLPC